MPLLTLAKHFRVCSLDRVVPGPVFAYVYKVSMLIYIAPVTSYKRCIQYSTYDASRLMVHGGNGGIEARVGRS